MVSHCSSDKLRAAREEALEGKDPGSMGLLRFLELSGVGRAVEDRTDEDQVRVERLDRWIVWEAEKRVAQ